MTKRSLQDWANIAEIAAAIAVVCSIVYLGLEVRDNTRATESATRQGFAMQDMVFIDSAIDSSIVARAVAKRESGEELSNLENSQLVQWQHLNFRIFENAYYQYKKGMLDESEWKRYEVIIRKNILHNRAAQEMWEGKRHIFTPDFAAVVDGLKNDIND